MTLLFIGFLFLGSFAVFAGLAFAQRGEVISKRAKIGLWASGLFAIVCGGYVWLFVHSFTLVVVTSNCADYSGVVSAGPRHSPVFRTGTTDYFWIVDPYEGSVTVEGRNGPLMAYGYVTSFGMERIDFSLGADCKGRATQTNIELE